MGEPAKQKATYDDLYNIPENMTGEIIDGELHTFPRPSPKHVKVTSDIGTIIGYPYRFGRGGPGGWQLLDSFVENDNVRVEPFHEIEIDLAELWLD